LNSAATKQDATFSATTAWDGQASSSTSEVTAAAISYPLCAATAMLQWAPE